MRPRLIPSLFTLLAVSIMCGLGVWQIQRLHWKEALLAEIATAQTAPELDLDNAAEAPPYHAVKLTGTFLHDKELHLIPRTHEGEVGAEILTPFRQADGRLWLVNRGWVPETKTDPLTRQTGQVSGPVEIHGRIRQPSPRGWMQPDNNPARNQWFFIDLPAMYASAQLGKGPANYIEADGTPNPGGLPIGGVTAAREIPNNHLEYAITWFALAGILLAVFLLSARRPR